jgi:hypothetical protein
MLVEAYQCSWRICLDINAFFRSKYHMFYVLYQFVSYLLNLTRIFCRGKQKKYRFGSIEGEKGRKNQKVERYSLLHRGRRKNIGM